MPKITKIFKSESEYFADYKYLTNSHLLYFMKCPYFYLQKRKGNVEEISRDYFIYGSAVDKILSGEDPEKSFFIGKAPKESVAILEEGKKCILDDIAERKRTGKTPANKKPLKTQITKLEKYQDNIAKAKELEGKIKITSTVFGNVMDTANEMKSQPLYEAFSGADPQTILATEIDGVKVKCMLDKLDLKNGIICDDKTTANMNTFDVEMYMQQLAWYRKIVREVHGVEADCYLAVADKYSDYKRSSMYHITKSRLDYQEAINKGLLKELVEAQKKNEFPPCTEIRGEEARVDTCFDCDFYKDCPHSRQKNFIVI